MVVDCSCWLMIRLYFVENFSIYGFGRLIRMYASCSAFICNFAEIEVLTRVFPIVGVALVLFFFFGVSFPQITCGHDIPLSIVVKFKQHHDFHLVVGVFSLYYREHFAYTIVYAVGVFIDAYNERFIFKRERHVGIVDT